MDGVIFNHCGNRVCPLLLAASLANSDRSVQIELQERNSVCCLEETCAWWANGSCAVAGALNGLLRATPG